MYRLLEILSVLALAAAGGYLVGQGGIGVAIIAFGAAFVFAVPMLHNAEEAEHGK
ncbi:hypothetical protein [Paenibacillus alvei]|uniref:hypothetical protein n=1 Tax=Paenibacillus alvei TaxID=44250 RepID=UPI0018CCB216|nr:hypothetical protein [Paenibacillus alvei]MCY9577968.1 hypothetical protein [Paenibacillus alvei]MCY9587762.1 hypothetical protein [Paenibacillus alvei]